MVYFFPFTKFSPPLGVVNFRAPAPPVPLLIVKTLLLESETVLSVLEMIFIL